MVFSYFYCKYSRRSLIFNLPVIYVGNQYWRIELSNVPFEKYFTEHLLSLEENPDLMLIESLFQEYRDNQSLIEVLCDLSNPKADPLEPVAECLFSSPPTFIYYVKGKKERFESKEQDEQKAYQNYLKDKLREHFNNL